MSMHAHSTTHWRQRMAVVDYSRLARFLVSSIWILQVLVPWWTAWQAQNGLIVRTSVTALAIAFVGTYLWAVWRLFYDRHTWRSPFSDHQRWTVRAILGGVAAVLILWQGGTWGIVGLFFVIGTIITAPSRLHTRDGAIALGAMALLMIVSDATDARVIGILGWTAFLGIIIGSMMAADDRIADLIDERTAAGQLAVADERERIARDLHDGLGRDLSLLALKSELAGRMLREQPDRAQRELDEIETIARASLSAVRSVVAGPRKVILREELESASELLFASGIEEDNEPSDKLVPLDVSEVFAWTVREGITNVVRHSRATRCTIRIACDDDMWTLTIHDDGTHQPLADDSGTGLARLRGRIEEAGGTMTFEATPGHTLTVRIPANA